MGKVSKDDKIKLLEAKVSLLEAEVLLKDELLDFKIRCCCNDIRF